jgi:hypothetical protein
VFKSPLGHNVRLIKQHIAAACQQGEALDPCARTHTKRLGTKENLLISRQRELLLGRTMTEQFPASVPQLELVDVQMTPNGARPQVTLIVNRPITKYEARAAWDVFSAPDAPEGSTRISLRTMRWRRPPTFARLAKAITKISQHAAVLERQDRRIFDRIFRRIFKRHRSASKTQKQVVRQGGQKPPSE